MWFKSTKDRESSGFLYTRLDQNESNGFNLQNEYVDEDLFPDARRSHSDSFSVSEPSDTTTV